MSRRSPFGAELVPGGVHFRLAAPKPERVVLLVGEERYPMEREDADGFFSITVPGLAAGARYAFLLDDDPKRYADPASRHQPEGPEADSEVVDPDRFEWKTSTFAAARIAGHVLYEMHVGTFTEAGTFEAAIPHLRDLADLGVTTLELMPLASFPGRFGWGYDGVLPFALTHQYGPPDMLRAFVDEAHAHGLGVILDVVYNHFGPRGNYLREFYGNVFSGRANDWGESIDFDGPESRHIRELFLESAASWVAEYRLDGLRLDATQEIHDTSKPHFIEAVVQRARAAAGARPVWIVAENEPQRADLVRSHDAGGLGCDAVWVDDFHHAAYAAATGHSEAYGTDTSGSPQEFVSALKWGYLFQGQYYSWQGQPRGEPALDVPAKQCVFYLESHDQVANGIDGTRLHTLTSPARARALKALLLLAPQTPMLFQGQEFDASAPFLFFADHEIGLATAIREGRAKFLSQFVSMRDPELLARLPDPNALETFERCKLDYRERDSHSQALLLTRELLAMRRFDPVFARQRNDRIQGAVLGPDAFCIRYLTDDGADRLLLVNLGRDLDLHRAPEPLLAPPRNAMWSIRLSTEESRFGGFGVPALDAQPHLRLQGNSSTVLVPVVRVQRSEERPS